MHILSDTTNANIYCQKQIINSYWCICLLESDELKSVDSLLLKVPQILKISWCLSVRVSSMRDNVKHKFAFLSDRARSL